MIYSDEDKSTAGAVYPLFARLVTGYLSIPDVYLPPGVYRTMLVKAIGGFRKATRGARLRAGAALTERTDKIYHIPASSTPGATESSTAINASQALRP